MYKYEFGENTTENKAHLLIKEMTLCHCAMQ